MNLSVIGGAIRCFSSPHHRENERLSSAKWWILEIEAALIALIYRYRWQIELFCKWMKSILGNRHLMAESPAGVATQTYSAPIAVLTLQWLTAKRPTKRAM